jgi:hypothetical protein
MWLYLILFFIPVIAYFFNKRGNTKDVRFLCSYMILLAFFVGMSDMFGGYDRYIYGEVFDSIANITTAHQDYLLNGAFTFFQGEVGYTFLNIIISFFTENRYIFILVYTIIIYTLLFVSLKKYAENYYFVLILFMGLWFFSHLHIYVRYLGQQWLGCQYNILRNESSGNFF